MKKTFWLILIAAFFSSLVQASTFEARFVMTRTDTPVNAMPVLIWDPCGPNGALGFVPASEAVDDALSELKLLPEQLYQCQVKVSKFRSIKSQSVSLFDIKDCKSVEHNSCK